MAQQIGTEKFRGVVAKLKRKTQAAATWESQLAWLWSIFRAMLIGGISFIILYPILMKVSIAFKSRIDIYNPTVVWLPKNFTLDNVKLVFNVINYPETLLNTAMLSTFSTIFLTISCALAGYAFARLRFRGSNILFAGVVLTILVPPQTIMIPTYLNFKDFNPLGLIKLFNGGAGVNLLDTYWPFVLTAITANGLKSGLYIYIFRQFFRGLPKQIEDAAFVDGAGTTRTFFSIMVPNAVPAFVTVILFSFVWQWNDSYFTSLFLGNTNVLSTELTNISSTVAHHLRNSLGLTSNQLDPYYTSMLVDTGVLLAITPLIILYIFVQRYFVESVERTGLVE